MMGVRDVDLREEVLRKFSTERLVGELRRRGYGFGLPQHQVHLNALRTVLQGSLMRDGLNRRDDGILDYCAGRSAADVSQLKEWAGVIERALEE